jgi:hypothetical protein
VKAGIGPQRRARQQQVGGQRSHPPLSRALNVDHHRYHPSEA